MRHLIEVPDTRTQTALTAIAQATQNMETELGTVAVANLVMGSQHQLGVVAALTMAGIVDNAQEIVDALLGLASFTAIYLKALTPDPKPGEDDNVFGL